MRVITLNDDEFIAWTKLHVEEVRKKFRKIEYLQNTIQKLLAGEESVGEVTEEMIEQAKQTLISDLIPLKKFMTRCLKHEPDVHPSLYCKGNLAYCFSCGWKADPIHFVMELHDVSFNDAVRIIVGGKDAERKSGS